MNKREAAALLGVSERTVNRLVESGRLNVVHQKNAKGASEALFEEAEVRAFKEAPSPSQGLVKRGERQSLAVREAGDLRELLASLLDRDGAVRTAEKLTLTLREAAKLAGLSRGFLLEAIKAGSLKAAKRGRGWNVKRSDLEAYIDSL